MKPTLLKTLSLATASLYSAGALANTEPSAVYDTRSASMGGTGTAAAESGTASFHNPAALEHVKTVTATATLTPYMSQMHTPLGPEQRDSVRSFGPMTGLGGGLRLSEQFVAGLAGFMLAGSGAKYEAVPVFGGSDAEASAFAAEMQIPVAFQIHEAITVGAAYRLTYASISASVPQLASPTDPALGFVTPETTMSGVNPLGFSVGVLAKPAEGLRLGATYRSKVIVSVEGDSEVGGSVVAEGVESEFGVPHRVTVGAAYSLLEHDALTLTGDFRYLMYSDSHRAGGDSSLAADWTDAYTFNLGSEYYIVPMVPARIGVLYGKMGATPEAANPFAPPPGTMQGLTVGSGVRLTSVEVDVGGGYLWGGDHDVSATDPSSTVSPGEYLFDSFFFSLSTTLRM